ncbi:AAA family ATPase [Pseudobutyrivibrio sp.]|uniref:AAA family ATPase n=1 Tax=Pseudobutyrivibrio sp. TaxID=2014367 RepID=UPI0025F6AACA|nr:AAA family ATPase [Pseudobutyrivibrio sp.]
MPIKIWPKEFEKKEHINAAERFLLRNAMRNFKEGCFVVGIDPVGFATDLIHMGMYIKPNEGLITFSIVQGKMDPVSVAQYTLMEKSIEAAVYGRLLNSKLLIVKNGEKKELKFPYKHIFIFPEEDIPVTSCDEKTLIDFESFSAVRFFIPTTSKTRPKLLKDLKLFADVRMPYDSNFTEISDAECLAIFERLAPEYTVVLKEKDEVTVAETDDDLPYESEEISGNEVEYRTFYLDDYQVAQINEMGRGHRVILANAGAGKSVLLLSKAFKYASMYKDKNILLTCYNSNLADAYRFKKNCAGLNSDSHRKLYVLTLHKLVEKLFKEQHVGTPINGFATDEQIQECLDLIRSGRIKIRFRAIFIDEVQIFTPLYLELCYALLDKTDDALFLMAGDLNQTVRNQSRRGDAPWKKIDDGSLDFTGRVKYIEKNYRNSPEISAFLNRMLVYMNSFLSKLKMINIDEFEYDLFEKGVSNNVALKIKTAVARSVIQTETINAIKEIATKYHIGYSEMAVLYPVKGNKALNYHIQYWITTALDKERIPYSIISTTEDGQKSTYSGANGLVISSIDSSLGLDFRAVILTGLYPYTFVFDKDKHRKKLSNWDVIESLPDEDKETAQIQMRKLYTACSRAREVLYILSDVEKGTVIDDIIRSGEKK